MGIITKEYMLSAKEDLDLDKQRQTMDFFRFKFELAISPMVSLTGNRELNYLPVYRLFPEHNEFMTPLLITPQLKNGSTIKDLMKEENLRRIYHIGRTSLALRCIPDFENQTDQLQFIFRGMYDRDVRKSVKAVENVVRAFDMGETPCLEWYQQ